MNSPNGLSSSEYVAVNSNRLTRNKHDKTMNEFFCHSDVYMYSFFPRTVTEWNKLPSQLVNEDCPVAFSDGLQSLVTDDTSS